MLYHLKQFKHDDNILARSQLAFKKLLLIMKVILYLYEVCILSMEVMLYLYEASTLKDSMHLVTYACVKT